MSFVNPYSGSRALTADEIGVIKSTVPVLAEHGVTLTTNFYKKMFGKHPELKNVFNQAHQATGMQPKSLAAAVYAYAAHIDNLAPILPAVAVMVHKHCSLLVTPDQYGIVGSNLLETLDELLTSAGFARETIDAIISAWGVAYGQLANILIEEEEKLYKAAESAPNGWRGWKRFIVQNKVIESESGITSFYLKPEDNSSTPAYMPGQFTTVRVLVPAKDGQEAYYQPRQYTLSKPFDNTSFRITVKREDEVKAPHPLPAGSEGLSCPFLKQASPAGVVSNLIHQSFEIGSIVEVAPPFGVFTLNSTATTPVTLIGAGVGATPLINMAETALSAQRKVSFVYGCHDGAHHPMRSWLSSMKDKFPQSLQTRIFYSTPNEQDKLGGDYDCKGYIDVNALPSDLLQLETQDTDYYVCGPINFMSAMKKALVGKGVNADKVHMEKFGSGLVD